MIRETLEMLAQYGQTVVAFYQEPAPLQDNNDSAHGVPTQLDNGRWAVGHMEFSLDCVDSIEITENFHARVFLLGYRHRQQWEL
jgi:hypothetical protein